MKDFQLPVTQTEDVSLLQTSDMGWLDTVVTCAPVTWLGCDLLSRDPARCHELVTLSYHLGLGLMGPDLGELVGAAAVVEVTVGQHDMERLLRGRPQPRPAQVAREAVEANTRVYQEVALTPLKSWN